MESVLFFWKNELRCLYLLLLEGKSIVKVFPHFAFSGLPQTLKKWILLLWESLKQSTTF